MQPGPKFAELPQDAAPAESTEVAPPPYDPVLSPTQLAIRAAADAKARLQEFALQVKSGNGF